MNRGLTKSLCWLATVPAGRLCWRQAVRPTPSASGRTRHFYLGELEPAAETLSEYIDRHPGDADAASLDLAMVQLVSGQPDSAERTLRTVRDNLDELEQTDALEIGAEHADGRSAAGLFRSQLREGADACVPGADQPDE